MSIADLANMDAFLIRAVASSIVLLASIVVCAAVSVPKRRQWVLLIGCYGLYVMWGAWFAAVLGISTIINFLIGRWLRRHPTRLPLAIGILFNLTLLASFKYLPELSITLPFSSLHTFAKIVLPLGISFWTFQAMSYLFDLYREEDLDPDFMEFALYMAFFPVVIAGPVCRLPEMLPQFRKLEKTQLVSISAGISRIATGLLMMQIAKLLGQGIRGGDGITTGFDHASQWSGTDVWCLAFGYGLQLFFDFAGYSHIAIGTAQALGLTLPENFRRPFASTTPSVFWTRWHMSLSFWIRDYVFLPLAVLRREVWWRNLVLVFSMVLFGLWHKASLLFVCWGAYHGLLLVFHRLWQSLQRKLNWEPGPGLWTPFSWFGTMSLISFGWLFFRANSITQVKQMCSAVLSTNYDQHFLSGSLYGLVFGVAVGYALIALAIDTLDDAETEGGTRLAAFARNRWYWIPTMYMLLLIFVLVATSTQGVDAVQLMYRNF
jgi:alginate O-acetyltransferase complex protein AlgI